ncbi:methionyl-tRNA formyltransferase [Metarhizium album ARSEF 1941]|uniref:methionyl-tRNA formyltransferase n=1 Tax=Metarhizium album (strain ARSEF 1941) TaxID=1081103 RepID=A0A0B2X150_METAS|nr:methionyl-tRNA formyltransferase [Metarhizium album ARSEF 1941]KHN99392.1 methionyl-tRNA formyltransferase [Metarhizium album ARSEF 1941]
MVIIVTGPTITSLHARRRAHLFSSGHSPPTRQIAAENDALAMLRLMNRAHAHLGRAPPSAAPFQRRHGSHKASDPLRILFCGSDTFSCGSLRALHREHVENRALVEALDVMVLPGRRTGRGLKTVREVPCKTLAEQLNLPIHQRETFRNWEASRPVSLPRGTNLVVVVSFGLFVPPRILKSAKYGGLNVHPSLLPDLRGPAPLHRALLRGDTHVGVSLQTLDDRAFDHGTILAQSPAPGMPVARGASLQEVLSAAAAEGADMLIRGLRDGVHVPPREDVGWKAAELQGTQLVHAPKITKADGQVDWAAWTAEHFGTRLRVLGSVWTHLVSRKGVRKRVIFLDAAPAACAEGAVLRQSHEATLVCEHEGALVGDAGTGRHEARVMPRPDGSCLIGIRDGSWIRVGKVKVDGKPEQMAAAGLGSFVR